MDSGGSRARPSPWTDIGGETLTWNQAIVWGSAIIWGSTVDVNETAWGSAIIWGSGTTWGSAIIWGSNVVWTDSSWSEAIVWGSDYVGQANGTAIVWGSGAGPDAQSTSWKDLSGSSSGSAGSNERAGRRVLGTRWQAGNGPAHLRA